jgi:hypothetical protein
MIREWLPLLAVYAFVTVSCAQAEQVVMPHQADSLVSMVGVNTHLSYSGTAYARCWSSPCSSGNTVQSVLHDLGVRHIRDYYGPLVASSYVAEFTTLYANDGIQLDTGTADPNVNGQGGSGESAAQLAAVAASLGAALGSWDTANEQDEAGDPRWAADLLAEQQTIWNARGNSYPTSVRVFGPAMAQLQDYVTLQSTAPGIANYDDIATAHVYWGGYNPENGGYGNSHSGCATLTGGNCGVYGSMSFAVNSARIAFPAQSVAITESGYGTSAADGPGYYVDQSTQAKYETRLILQAYALGLPYLFIYELADEGNAPFSSYGLVDAQLNKKPGFFAVANLLATLADPGAPFTPVPFATTVTAPAGVQTLYFQKRNGINDIVLWQSAQSWNPLTATETTPASVNATITLGVPPSSIVVSTLNSTNGSLVRTSPAPATTLQIAVTDGFVIVQIAK